MATSVTARDILNLLGKESVIIIDSRREIMFHVSSKSVIQGSALTRAINLIEKSGMAKMHCSVDFEESQIMFKSEPLLVNTLLNLDPGNNLDTESEKAAADIVRSMGVMDLDNLRPECCIKSSNGSTHVHFSRLLHVSHNAVVHYLQEHKGVEVTYDMDNHLICVSLPNVSKRKR